MRYVGDMLAWVHQAIAAEREFLESLFGIKSDGRMVGSVRVFEGQSEEEDWVQELMDLAVGKLCVPLKVGFSLGWGCGAVVDNFFRSECSRRYGRRRAVLFPTRLRTSYNFTWSLCGGPLGHGLFSL